MLIILASLSGKVAMAIFEVGMAQASDEQTVDQTLRTGGAFLSRAERKRFCSKLTCMPRGSCPRFKSGITGSGVAEAGLGLVWELELI